MLEGMNVARFNFSHGSHEEQKARLDKLVELRKELNLPVAALLDTKGPEIRLKELKGGKAELKDCLLYTSYPQTDNQNWLKWINIRQGADGEMELFTEDIPMWRYPVRPQGYIIPEGHTDEYDEAEFYANC